MQMSLSLTLFRSMSLSRSKHQLRGSLHSVLMHIRALACVSALLVSLHPPVYGESILQGKLEHRESIQPLLQSQRPGEALTDPFTFPFATSEWFQVPQWAAGEWKQTGSLVIAEEQGSSRSIVQRNQNDVQTICLGQMLDRDGHIWHFGQRQAEKTLSKDNQTVEITGTYMTDLESGKTDTFKLKARTVKYLAKRVEVKTIINEVKRNEVIYTLKPLDGVLDTLVAEVQTREFGDDGQQTRYVESLAFWRRSRPFRVQTRVGQKDLLPLLTEFLRRTGQRSLVPHSSSN